MIDASCRQSEHSLSSWRPRVSLLSLPPLQVTGTRGSKPPSCLLLGYGVPSEKIQQNLLKPLLEKSCVSPFPMCGGVGEHGESWRVFPFSWVWGGASGQDYGVAAGHPEISSAPSLLPHGKAEQLQQPHYQGELLLPSEPIHVFIA